MCQGGEQAESCVPPALSEVTFSRSVVRPTQLNLPEADCLPCKLDTCSTPAASPCPQGHGDHLPDDITQSSVPR